MAGKSKRKKFKLLVDTKVDDESVLNAGGKEEEKFEHETWPDLPTELLELVISRLSLEDNIRSSAVCKKWYLVAFSVRVINPCPWLLYFPKVGNLFEIYDPSTRKTHYLELPELVGSTVCYTKDGWLLLYKVSKHRLFFFHPFTREIIKLPKFELSCQIVGFSSAPTCSSCVIFTLKHINPTLVAISTCHPGETEWETANHNNRLPFCSSMWNKVVFSSGVFYCLSLTGWIGVFDPLEQTWEVPIIPSPKCTVNFYTKNWWKGKFMAEHEGEIYVVYTCCGENPIVFKLNEIENVWEEKQSLDGVTLFASFLTSHSRTSLHRLKRNNIYFSKVRFYGKRCISYSLDDCRYYPCKESFDWGEQNPFESIWIEPPLDLTNFR